MSRGRGTAATGYHRDGRRGARASDTGARRVGTGRKNDASTEGWGRGRSASPGRALGWAAQSLTGTARGEEDTRRGGNGAGRREQELQLAERHGRRRCRESRGPAALGGAGVGKQGAGGAGNRGPAGQRRWAGRTQGNRGAAAQGITGPAGQNRSDVVARKPGGAVGGGNGARGENGCEDACGSDPGGRIGGWLGYGIPYSIDRVTMSGGLLCSLQK